MTWHWNEVPADAGIRDYIAESMNNCVATWNSYSNYNYDIGVIYSSGTPTADAGYLGQIRFGGSRNYRTAMHESSHWMGTGSVSQWDLHQRFSIWNGTYNTNLRRAVDGPGERQFIYGVHYGPNGSNYDSEGVQGDTMVHIIGGFRRDMGLAFGDLSIGVPSGVYRLRNRQTIKVLDSLGATAEGAQVKQGENLPGTGQQWQISLIPGTTYFTIQNLASGKYLDSLGGTTDGSPVGMTTLSGAATDAQQWQINATDSFFFKIVNKASGKVLDNLGQSGDGDGVAQWTAGSSWNQQWTFLHPMEQLPAPAGVISQGRPVASSSTDGGNYDLKGNNGVSGDRWTAADGTFPQWWRVDTGSVQPITKVAVDWFPNGAPTFQYRIEVSDNDVNWTVAADRTGNTVTGTTVDQLSGVSGRFVRVTVTGASAGYAAFMECRVYNEAQPMKNLSQFRPTTASSEQDGNLAVNATDVDPVFTRWCSASSGYPAWWQVDLGTAQQVNKAVISWFDDDARSYKYRIEGSTDGTNFTTLIDRTDNTAPYTTSDSFSGLARYVRVTVTGGSSSYPSIYDAQIYGATSAQAPAAPGSVTATAAGSQINVSWAAVSGATSYTLKRSLGTGGPYTTLATQAGTSFADTNVLAGIAYHYVASATNGIGTGPNSAEAIAATGAELQAHLPFDETAGTFAADASGFGRNGALINGALWAAGNVANAVDLDGSDDYVALPAGVVSGLNNFTIAAWVNPDANSNWARLFDFGSGTDNYMFLAPTNGSAVRFAIRTAAVNEQQLTGATPLPTGTWSHVAVTLSGNSATLYVNGVSVATNNAMTLRPSSLGITTQNWIGRSQFADPYLNGRVDDFRIYNRALSVAEIGKLRGITAAAVPASLTAQAGDGQIAPAWSPALGATSYKVKRATVSGGPYSLIATVSAAGYLDSGLSNGTGYYYVVSAVNAAADSVDSVEASATPAAAAPAAPAYLYASEVSTKVKLAWAGSAGSASYKVKRSTVSGGPYTVIGNVGVTNFTDSTATPGTGYYYVVSAVSGGGAESTDSAQAGALPSAATPALSLKMDEASGTIAADDSGNALNATLVNGPTRVTGRLDRAISLDGTDDHATLPAGAVSTLNDFTISTWVRASAVGTWSRVFDFGTGTANYMFLTLKSGTGKPRFAIRSSSVAEQVIDSSVAFPLNVWTHVAVTLSGNNATLYMNGVVVGGNGTMTLKPASLGNTTLNYLGRSQFPDPYFGGMIDEFQIRNRALSGSEVSDLAAPPLAPTGFTATAGMSNISLAWNASAGATGYNVQRATSGGGPFTKIAANVSSTGYVDAAVTGGTTYYYIVTAVKTVAESAKSGQVSETPSSVESWRQGYFGTTEDAGIAADDADPDGDGWINANEYAAGTDPTDGSSKLAISALVAGGNDITVSFPSVLGRHYTVQYSDALAVDGWQTVLTNGTPASGIVGTGAAMQVIDSGGAGQGRRFYRISVTP